MSSAPEGHQEPVRKLYPLSQDRTAVSASAVQDLLREVETVCLQREEVEQGAVARLSREVSEIHARCIRPEPEGAHQERVHKLRAQTLEVRANTESLLSQLRALEGEQSELRSKQLQTGKSLSEVHFIVQDTEPRCRYELSLYAHISNLVWDSSDRGTVAGTVVDRALQEIQHFSWPVESLTQFELVNKLWTVIN